MSKAVLFFADGTEECEALLVADLLRRARVEVIIASAMGRRALVSSHGIHLNADALAHVHRFPFFFQTALRSHCQFCQFPCG